MSGIDKLSWMQALSSASIEQARELQLQRQMESRSATAMQKTNDVNGIGEASGRKALEQKIEKASTDFEALLLQQMFKSMWAAMTNESEGPLGSGQHGEYYRDLMTQELSQSIAEKQSLGIKQILIADMRKREGLES